MECPSCGACFDGSAETCDRDGRVLTLSLPVARTLDGKYRLDQLIGKGGMGAVYEARDLRLERFVALKILTGHRFGDEQTLRRFEREARAVAKLSHPRIVRVYDYGSVEGKAAYLVMERLHGQTLRAELNRAGVLTPGATAAVFDELLDGVSAAHSHGIVHRDLKPENIVGQWQDGHPELKILDFGLAKTQPLDSAITASSITASGVILGTFGSTAPEQLLGKKVDHRADIFALGVILVEVLTGSRPFRGETLNEYIRAVLFDKFHLPAELPEVLTLDAVLQRCLAKEPQDRFNTVADMHVELIPILRKCPQFTAGG
jgi:serine/threonine-protein kinase